jgi:hypothetical protein
MYVCFDDFHMRSMVPVRRDKPVAKPGAAGSWLPIMASI